MKTFLHFFASLVLWGIFLYYWYIVSGQEIGGGTSLAIKVLSGLAVVGILITILWVAHNLRLARVNRRTSSRPCPPESLTRDRLGRPVDAPDLATLREAALVDITVTEAGKSYRPVSREG